MAALRNLLGQTAIYGVSSIIGRLLNYFLTPLYTRIFIPEQYGVITELYAFVAFLLVILTYGMETAFFRFGSRQNTPEGKDRVFSTAFISVGVVCLLFACGTTLAINPISEALHYGNHPEYILLLAWIVALDAIITIPFARLRLMNRAVSFAAINITSILVTIGLNLFFLLYCPYAINEQTPGHEFIAQYYDPHFGVGYVFMANLIGSLSKMFFLIPSLSVLKVGFDLTLYKKLIPYALPLLVLGLAGIINETFDRAFYTDLSPLPELEAKAELGIYGACYKVAMLLSIGIQAYRFAAEPFIFSLSPGSSSDETQARIMKFYFITALLISLAILCFQDLALLLIDEEYRQGKGVIPILIGAYIFFGAVFNLSFWYKLNNKTVYGALIALIGAAITIVTNIILVPEIGYYGSAWATFWAYLAMASISYFLSRWHYPIPYDLRSIAIYIVLATVLISMHWYVDFEGPLKYVSGIVVLIIFSTFTLFKEKILLRPIRNGKN